MRVGESCNSRFSTLILVWSDHFISVFTPFQGLTPLSDSQNEPPAYEDVVKDPEPIQESSSEKSPSLNGVCESPSPTPVIIVDEEELSR